MVFVVLLSQHLLCLQRCFGKPVSYLPTLRNKYISFPSPLIPSSPYSSSIYSWNANIRPEKWRLFNLIRECNTNNPSKGRDPLKAFETASLDFLFRDRNPFRHFDDYLEDVGRIAKYNHPLKELLLEMITQPDRRVYEEFPDGHPPLTWRMLAIAILQREKVLPAQLWDQYREQVIQYITTRPDLERWRDILPDANQSLEGTKTKHLLKNPTHWEVILDQYIR